MILKNIKNFITKNYAGIFTVENPNIASVLLPTLNAIASLQFTLIMVWCYTKHMHNYASLGLYKDFKIFKKYKNICHFAVQCEWWPWLRNTPNHDIIYKFRKSLRVLMKAITASLQDIRLQFSPSVLFNKLNFFQIHLAGKIYCLMTTATTNCSAGCLLFRNDKTVSNCNKATKTISFW